jgi:hypothetical protein
LISAIRTPSGGNALTSLTLASGDVRLSVKQASSRLPTCLFSTQADIHLGCSQVYSPHGISRY